MKAKHENENRRQVESSSGDKLINHSSLKSSKTQEINLQPPSKPVEIEEDMEQELTQGFSSPFGQALLKRKHEIYKESLGEQENFENNNTNLEGLTEGHRHHKGKEDTWPFSTNLLQKKNAHQSILSDNQNSVQSKNAKDIASKLTSPISLRKESIKAAPKKLMLIY